MARSLRDRLVHELGSVRKELREAIPFTTQGPDYAPEESMKSYRKQLTEIGAMEFESLDLMRTGVCPRWRECESHVAGETVAEIFESLERIREQTLAYLNSLSDNQLEEPIPIPEDWFNFFGDKELQRQELFRWIARHEYYHCGQIVTYNWIAGYNPYRANG